MFRYIASIAMINSRRLRQDAWCTPTLISSFRCYLCHSSLKSLRFHTIDCTSHIIFPVSPFSHKNNLSWYFMKNFIDPQRCSILYCFLSICSPAPVWNLNTKSWNQNDMKPNWLLCSLTCSVACLSITCLYTFNPISRSLIPLQFWHRLTVLHISCCVL